VLRRFGFRTASEIDHEWYALKALRGDFASYILRNVIVKIDLLKKHYGR